MLAGDRSQGVVEARSVLRALSRVSQFPELCALARILFYVTFVRIRVFIRTLESNLVLQLFAALVITLDMSGLVPAILIGKYQKDKK